MLISRPFDPSARLPRRHGNCGCNCHRMSGVYHCIPCCGPGRGYSILDELKEQVDSTPTLEEARKAVDEILTSTEQPTEDHHED